MFTKPAGKELQCKNVKSLPLIQHTRLSVAFYSKNTTNMFSSKSIFSIWKWKRKKKKQPKRFRGLKLYPNANEQQLFFPAHAVKYLRNKVTTEE